MAQSSKRALDDITQSSVYKQLKGHLYFPYYLSGPKVEMLFTQLWGDIRGFSKAHSTELSSALGIEGKTSGLLKWLAEIAVSAHIGGAHEWSFASNYDVPDLARFVILHRFLTESGRVKGLLELTTSEKNTPHLFVEYAGPFSFATDAGEMGVAMTGDARAEIARRKKFEETAEKDPHFIFVIPCQPKAIALIANRYFSPFGHRFLPHFSERRSVNFFGAIIGEAKGLLFLDPIAIGYRDGGGNDTPGV